MSELEAEEFHDDFAEALEDIDLDELLAMADDDTASNASSKGLFFRGKIRENVAFSHFLAVDNFVFTRKIINFF